MNSTGSQADKDGQAVSNAVLLSPDDNVIVACRFIRAGETVTFADRSIISGRQTLKQATRSPVIQSSGVSR